MPQWRSLTSEVRQPLVALLMRMLQQHLPVPNPGDEREVGDESR
jgi:hypothetical protein